MEIRDWLDVNHCPPQRPQLAQMAPKSRALHESIDAHTRASGVAYLHPKEKTVQLDVHNSARVVDWQERKVAFLFEGEGCWSELPQLYGRYGTELGNILLAEIRALEHASAALACDSGMTATATVFDVLMQPGKHAVLSRQVYNKTAKYLSYLADRSQCTITVVDDGDHAALAAAITPATAMVFAETFTNPKMRALDLDAVPRIVRAARKIAPGIKLVVDSTIATAWGIQMPLLDQGVDVVVFSGTKAFGGQDTDLGGFVATNDSDLANAAMDLLAMRGGILDWRRAEAFLAGLAEAKDNHRRRCQSASQVAAFLDRHPLVSQVFHPSLPNHPDADAIARGYSRYGSLLSFRIPGEEADAQHLSDAIATCTVIRYALSFDGLCSKVNHHKSVSEYFTPQEVLRKQGIDRLIRLGVGLEDPDDICAALNWALHRGSRLSPTELREWSQERR